MSEHTTLTIKEKIEVYVLLYDEQNSLEEVLNKYNIHVFDLYEIINFVENMFETSLKLKGQKNQDIKRLKRILIQKTFDWPSFEDDKNTRNNQQNLFEIIEWTHSPGLSQQLACLVLTQSPMEKAVEENSTMVGNGSIDKM
ncbi:hypothetical protein [Natribacillus halophilus]|uniref:Uncharacterized protein n=1 Tax=Natribacillus halophilus TaxID=549003 RepID=A0A1G8R7D1_9BACI|nr:hypothetical protein [Natribacillus halophilus]SDJ12896.1 hypothetical protein SAMN04488123_1162 [Natribacillus halophilus]